MLLRDCLAIFLLLEAFDVQRHSAAAEAGTDIEVKRARLGGQAGGRSEDHDPRRQRRRQRRLPRQDRPRHHTIPFFLNPVSPAYLETVMLIVVLTCMTELLPKFCKTEVMPALLSIE